MARGGKAEEEEEREEREEREHDRKGGRVALAKGGTLSTHGSSDKRKSANVYNAAGSPTMSEAQNETPSFNKGGRMKRKSGGTTEGFASGGRLDQHARRARGGSTRTPYSTGSELSMPTDDREGRGYEGGKPA
jgi:hypothetical protein